MHRSARLLAALVACAALAGCGNLFGPGHACTLIGARVGVSLDVEPSLAAKVSAASMKVCWDGTCRTPKVRLHPSTTPVPQPCSDVDPGDACGASAVPTGGKHGFGTVKELPKKPVRVTVVLTDESGERVFRDSVRVTPEAVYPNGPDCGAGGPQAGVVAAGDRLRAES